MILWCILSLYFYSIVSSITSTSLHILMKVAAFEKKSPYAKPSKSVNPNRITPSKFRFPAPTRQWNMQNENPGRVKKIHLCAEWLSRRGIQYSHAYACRIYTSEDVEDIGDKHLRKRLVKYRIWCETAVVNGRCYWSSQSTASCKIELLGTQEPCICFNVHEEFLAPFPEKTIQNDKKCHVVQLCDMKVIKLQIYRTSWYSIPKNFTIFFSSELEGYSSNAYEQGS